MYAVYNCSKLITLLIHHLLKKIEQQIYYYHATNRIYHFDHQGNFFIY